MRVYDIAGRLISELHQGIARKGVQELFWDGTDGSGRQVESGVYLCKVEALECTSVEKLILVR